MRNAILGAEHTSNVAARLGAYKKRGDLSFTEAVQICFRKYADFAGRARRPEYWWWVLFVFLVDLVVNALGGFQPILVLLGRGESGESTAWSVLAAIVSLLLLLPGLAVFVRRLHDTGRSGWWWLIVLVPLVGAIVLIVFLAQEGDPGPNQYGPSPTPAG
jgi:uncharacterized membrane protein YhaH (DUF805 family)